MVKNNTVLRAVYFLFLAFFHITSVAQKSIDIESYSHLKAFEDFQSRLYKRVINELERDTDPGPGEDILLQLSRLNSGYENESKIEQWVENNPKHPLNLLASYHLGAYYFYKRDSVLSRKYLAQIKPGDLTQKDNASYGFIYGVLELDLDRYKSAKRLFEFSLKNEPEDPIKVVYYLAYANYHLGDTEAALEQFNQAQTSELFSSSARFFIAKISLDNGDIDPVIALAQGELSDEKTSTNSGFHQLIGEAYALKDNEAKADAYFERAIQLHPGRPTTALYYQAGVAKFKIGNEDKAIEYLTKAGIQGGQYAQLSALQLGRLYIKKGNYQRALTAYIEASASDDMQMKEESIFNAAFINAKLDQYTDAINYGNDYLKAYSDNPRSVEIQNLIAQSYLKTSNYDLAIEQLKKAGVSNATQRDVYQKVTFQKAFQSFNDGDFKSSQSWFNESLKYTPDQALKNQAHYHLGEIQMRNNKYDEAIDQYLKQSSFTGMTNYGLGYAYFNQAKYKKAQQYFQNVVSSDERISLDAQVRLADCYYATKSYEKALTIYQRLSKRPGSPYITYQQGMCLKELDRKQEAIQTFRSLFSNQTHGAEARFQSGLIHFESAQFSQAEPYFSKVINDFPTHSLVPEALLNRGVCWKNMEKLEESKRDYETILKEYINEEIALNAILGLQELQQSGLEVDRLDQYITKYKQANPESGSLEFIEFESAKRLYFNFSYENAASAFNKFLKDYPTSSNKTEAKYYMADSYYRLNELEKSLSVFDELRYVRNNLTGRILVRLGDINKRLRRIEASQEAFQLLIDLNLTSKDTYNARQGLMYLFFENQMYVEAVKWADNIIKGGWMPVNGEQEAVLIKAKSRYSLGDLSKAKTDFQLLSNGVDIYGAESNYLLGLISYEQGLYDESLDILFDLNASYGSYTNWIDKSYLLIARNYIGKDEIFQAKATLRSIIQHSKNENIINESLALLQQIEQDNIQEDTTQNED